MGILERASAGKVQRPLALIIYGTDSVGKTTFASKAPNPLFEDVEKGTHKLDVKRLEPASFEQYLEHLDALYKEKHNYQSVVTDSVDWLEKLLFQHVCDKYKGNGPIKRSIEDFGYQKGYIYALEVWENEVIPRYEKIRDKGINVILIGHSLVKTWQDPINNVGYDRHIIKMHHTGAAVLREWADCVLFADFETNVYEEGGKQRAISEGERIIYSEKRASFDAKSRLPIPFEMKLDWDVFYKEWSKAWGEGEKKPNIANLEKKIKSLLRQVDDKDIIEWTEGAIKKKANRNVKKFTEIISKLEKQVEAA